MAKLDWQKAVQKSVIQMQDSEDRAMKTHRVDVYKMKMLQIDKGIIVFGKHKGKPLETLTTGYLKWLTQNVSSNKWTHKTLEQAKTIIKQRQTTQKVGGPVSNTAEQKV